MADGEVAQPVREPGNAPEPCRPVRLVGDHDLDLPSIAVQRIGDAVAGLVGAEDDPAPVAGGGHVVHPARDLVGSGRHEALDLGGGRVSQIRRRVGGQVPLLRDPLVRTDRQGVQAFPAMGQELAPELGDERDRGTEHC